jgi:hypothetical protein
MEDLPLIQSMATHLATNLTTPVSCKIRIFPDMGETLAENPALFAGHRMKPVEDVAGSLDELSREGALNEPALALEYWHLCEKYPVTKKMIRARVYELLVGWFKRYPELRDKMNGEQGVSIDWIEGMVDRLLERHVASMAGGCPRESADAEISGLAQQHESLVQVMWFDGKATEREWTATSIEASSSCIHKLPLRHFCELLEALLRGLWVGIEELGPVSDLVGEENMEL